MPYDGFCSKLPLTSSRDTIFEFTTIACRYYRSRKQVSIRYGRVEEDREFWCKWVWVRLNMPHPPHVPRNSDWPHSGT